MGAKMSVESTVQNQVLLTGSQFGMLLQRNNNGACIDETGRLIRYGLMNESKKVNQEIKSSDLIGITPVQITGHMVGRTVGIYTALECKETGWKMRPSDDRAKAQLKYIELVRSYGGIAGFCSDPAHIQTLFIDWLKR